MALTTNAALRKDRTTATSVTLQHRHFAFIASVIKGMPDFAPSLRTAKMSTALAFADACMASNPKFDRARFYTACGVEGN
jgi:hypothetical protein